MELKNEEKVNAEYAKNDEGTKQQNEQLNSNDDASNRNKSAKSKKSLKKWGIVGATLVVAGIVGVTAYVNYQNSMAISGGLQMDLKGEIYRLNNEFESYFGKNKSLHEIRNLVSMTNVHNLNSWDVDFYGEIKISGDDIVTYNEKSKLYSVDGPNAKTINRYTIDANAYRSDGAISEIKIEVYDRTKEE